MAITADSHRARGCAVSEFIPDYRGEVKRNPLAPDDHEEFPFDDVFDNLDGLAAHVEKFDTELGRQQLVEFVRRFIEMLTRDERGLGNRTIYRVGKRAVILAWLMNPKIFSGEALSLTALAGRLGLTAPALCKESARLSKCLHIRNRFQAHWNGREMSNPPSKGGYDGNN